MEPEPEQGMFATLRAQLRRIRSLFFGVKPMQPSATDPEPGLTALPEPERAVTGPEPEQAAPEQAAPEPQRAVAGPWLTAQAAATRDLTGLELAMALPEPERAIAPAPVLEQGEIDPLTAQAATPWTRELTGLEEATLPPPVVVDDDDNLGQKM